MKKPLNNKLIKALIFAVIAILAIFILSRIDFLKDGKVITVAIESFDGCINKIGPAGTLDCPKNTGFIDTKGNTYIIILEDGEELKIPKARLDGRYLPNEGFVEIGDTIEGRFRKSDLVSYTDYNNLRIRGVLEYQQHINEKVPYVERVDYITEKIIESKGDDVAIKKLLEKHYSFLETEVKTGRMDVLEMFLDTQDIFTIPEFTQITINSFTSSPASFLQVFTERNLDITEHKDFLTYSLFKDDTEHDQRIIERRIWGATYHIKDEEYPGLIDIKKQALDILNEYLERISEE